MKQIICEHCGNSYSSHGIGSHKWRMHGAGIAWTANNDGYKDGSRKGTNQYIKGTRVGHSLETREKIRQENYANPRGIAVNPDLRSGNGKSLKIPYIDSFGKECLLESSWEWKMANDLDRNNIRWKRAWTFRIKTGQTYTPDFFLLDYDIYLDPKGWENPKQTIRINLWKEQYGKTLLIIKKQENLTWEHVRSSLNL